MSDLSTGQIVGGIIGAVIGTYANPGAGTVQGFAIGAGIGGYIDPPAGPLIRAPRLNDRSFQSSAYGTDIPLLFGTMGFYGNVIYLENGEYKEVVKKESQGGKGGGGGATVESVEYFATFAVAFHEVKPGSKIRKLWLGGKLFYDAESAADKLASDSPPGTSEIVGGVLQSGVNGEKFRYYDGTQTVPDSRIEAVVGTANAEAWTGTAYIILYDLPLKEFGNGLQGAPVKAEIVSDYTDSVELIDSGNVNFTRDSYTTDYVVRPVSITSDRILLSAQSLTSGFYGFTRCNIDFDGNFSVTDHPPTTVNGIHSGMNDRFYIYDRADDIHGPDTGFGLLSMFYPDGGYQERNGRRVWFNRDSQRVLGTTVDGVHSYHFTQEIFSACISSDGFVYTTDITHIRKWDIDLNELASVAHSLSVTLDSQGPAGIVGMWHDGGKLYIGEAYQNELKDTFTVYKDDLSAVERTFTLAGTSNDSTECEFIVEGDLLIRAWGEGESSSPPERFHYDKWNINPIDRYLEPLDAVVQDILNRVGVDSSLTDLTGISSDNVRGFLAPPGDARGSLSSLQVAYNFDLVPDGYKIKAVKRGAASVVTIPYEDLGTVPFGSQSNELLPKYREMDTQLPHKYKVKYLDVAREYDEGQQESVFPTTSENERSAELALALTSDEAIQIADYLINVAWVARDRFPNFTLPQTYIDLITPATVATIETPDRDYQVYINSVEVSDDQILTVQAMLDSPALYQSQAVGVDGNNSGGGVVDYIAATDLSIIDCPMLIESTDTYGVVAACNGYGSWPGASLFKSIDDGQTYNNIQSFSGVVPQGVAVNVLSEHDGFTIDRDSDLIIRAEHGVFSSITEAQMLTGQNYFVYGTDGRWELCLYADAALNSDGTYSLTNLVRGYRGTEWATGLHQIDDKIIFISDNDVDFVSLNASRLLIENVYKAVTFTQFLANASEVRYTYQGENLKPLPPAQFTASESGGDWTFTAVGRTRYESSFWSTGVQPANEPVLSYELDILDSSGDSVRTLSSTDLNFTYTAAQQTTDFGSQVSTVSANVYQLSARVGRGRPASGDFIVDVWPFVVLQYRFNGTDGSTTFLEDKSISNSTVTGSAEIKTAQSKFGGAAALFASNGDYITHTNNQVFNGDLTIECWFRANSTITIFEFLQTGGTDFIHFEVTASLGKKAKCELEGNGVSVILEGTSVLSLNTWYHLAVTRSGSTVKLFVNGVAEDTDTFSETVDINTSYKIGGYFSAADYYLDDLRILNGLALYKSDFSPPTKELETQL